MTNPIVIETELKEFLTKLELKIDKQFEEVNRKIDKLDEEVKGKFEKFEGKIDKQFEEVNRKIDKLDEEVNRKIDKVDEKVDSLSVEVATVKGKVEALDKRFDNLEFISRGIIIGLIVALLGSFAKILGFMGNP